MFREDVYGRDAGVLAALDGRGPIRIIYQGSAETESTVSTLPEKRKTDFDG
jgi:hypothetical protein